MEKEAIKEVINQLTYSQFITSLPVLVNILQYDNAKNNFTDVLFIKSLQQCTSKN